MVLTGMFLSSCILYLRITAGLPVRSTKAKKMFSVMCGTSVISIEPADKKHNNYERFASNLGNRD